MPEHLRPGQVLALGNQAAVLEVSGEVLLYRGAAAHEAVATGIALGPGDVLIAGRNGFVTVGFIDGTGSSFLPTAP